MPTADVQARREQVVLDHFRDEVAQQWDDVLATFPHPRYEVVATETVHDGDAAVRGYYAETRVAFPDQRHELIALRHSEDAVVVEFHLLGTHRGPLGPVPATGSPFKVRMTAYFVFDDRERLVAERIYFDQLTLLRQLISGLNLRSPAGILKLLAVLRGFAQLAKRPKDVIPDGDEATVGAAAVRRG
jgi:steroid delta-isomerase-like uncharacterized protein